MFLPTFTQRSSPTLFRADRSVGAIKRDGGGAAEGQRRARKFCASLLHGVVFAFFVLVLDLFLLRAILAS
jgi:hypothetical protein